MTILERMALAMEDIRARTLRVCQALESAGVAYAIIGGNAVAAWVSTVQIGAARSTRDVDLLLNRSELPRAVEALEKVGFQHRRLGAVDVFIDPSAASLPGQRVEDSVHVVFSNEKVRPGYSLAAPDLAEAQRLDEFTVLSLEALVRMKLTSYRRKDQVHLLDLLAVGLIDASWTTRYPVPLDARLQELLDNPD